MLHLGHSSDPLWPRWSRRALAVPNGDLGGPTKAGGNAPIPDVFHPVQICLGESAPERSGIRPSTTAVMAGPAKGFILTNHCLETRGSHHRVAADSERATHGGGLRPLARVLPYLDPLFDYPPPALQDRKASVGTGLFSHFAIGADDLNLIQTMALTHIKVAGIVGRGHFDYARAELGIDGHRR